MKHRLPEAHVAVLVLLVQGVGQSRQRAARRVMVQPRRLVQQASVAAVLVVAADPDLGPIDLFAAVWHPGPWDAGSIIGPHHRVLEQRPQLAANLLERAR